MLAAAVMLVVCCGGKVYGIMPFGTPMFCALCGEVFIGFAAPEYVLCSFLFTFELWRLYASGAVVFIMAIRWFVALKFPKFAKPAVKIAFIAAAILVETVIVGLFRPITEALLGGCVGGAFCYFASNSARAAGRRFAYRLGAVESASVCAVLIVAGLAFGRASYGAFDIGLAFAFFSALVFGVIGTKAALACAVSIGLGLGLGADIATAVSFVACAAAACMFRPLARPLRALAGIGVFAAFAVLLGVNAVDIGWCSLMLACGALPFVCLPRRAVNRIAAYFDFDGTARLAVRHFINRSKADAGNRMLAVASVFDETARLMNVFSPLPPDYNALGMALSDKICPYCPKTGICDRLKSSPAFAAVAECAYAGRSVIASLPEFFSDGCPRTVDIISASAELTEAARRREHEQKTEDKAKAIVTERLTAVKDVLECLGVKEAAPVGFDGTAEQRIVAELNLYGVECAEAFVTKNGVTAIVRTQSADRARIAKAVSVCMKCKYEVTALDKTQAAGWSVATASKRPAYEAVYARAGVAKSGVSGDSFGFERVGDKFVVSLLDGMGSGERAGAGSDAAVELIRCFYKAGFDSQSVLSGVNRFLKLPSAENYSAADVIVCDLDTAGIDIFKIGAPPCYIKTRDTVLKIEGGSLPIGVLDEMRPFAASKRLYPGQMLILVTDGVSDCFSGDELPEYINGLTAFNPETVSDAVLRRALELSGGTPRDDMTVIAFRLFDAAKYKRVRVGKIKKTVAAKPPEKKPSEKLKRA